MQYSLEHNIETDVDTFWKLFFDPEFNQKLYLDHLKFTTYRLLEDHTASDGMRQRRVECVPKIDIPAAAQAFFGNSAGYVEIGRFDPVAGRYFMDIVPAFRGDKVKTTSQLWIEPIAPKRVTRKVTGEVKVNIFGLSKLIESVAKQQSQETYTQSAEFTNRWLQANAL